jgi:hypothetical protein
MRNLWIDYTNWRGERRWREVTPDAILWHQSTDTHHTEPCWIMVAIDVDRQVVRAFELTKIHAMSKEKPK